MWLLPVRTMLRLYAKETRPKINDHEWSYFVFEEYFNEQQNRYITLGGIVHRRGDNSVWWWRYTNEDRSDEQGDDTGEMSERMLSDTALSLKTQLDMSTSTFKNLIDEMSRKTSESLEKNSIELTTFLKENSEEFAKSSKKVISNINLASDTLVKKTSDLDKTLENLNKTTESFNENLNTLNSALTQNNPAREISNLQDVFDNMTNVFIYRFNYCWWISFISA